MIYWAGVSSDDVRVIVEHYPNRIIPARKLETVSVPGRNGDLVFTEEAYQNYVQPYDIYVSAEEPRLPLVARGVAAWLQGVRGYQQLEDGYEPDVYRLAYFSGPLDLANILNRFGRATISFNCKPQRFLKTGERSVRMEQADRLRNETPFAALPLLRIYGSGVGSLFVGGYAVTFSDISGYVDLDCDTQNAYKGVENKNAGVSFVTDCPKLVPGENEISWSGGVSAVEITPRWWIL